jgi:hypothetical protein
MTKEQEESLTWVEDCIKGRKMGASTSHLKNLLSIIGEQFEEIELLSHQNIER